MKFYLFERKMLNFILKKERKEVTIKEWMKFVLFKRIKKRKQVYLDSKGRTEGRLKEREHEL